MASPVNPLCVHHREPVNPAGFHRDRSSHSRLWVYCFYLLDVPDQALA